MENVLLSSWWKCISCSWGPQLGFGFKHYLAGDSQFESWINKNIINFNFVLLNRRTAYSEPPLLLFPKWLIFTHARVHVFIIISHNFTLANFITRLAKQKLSLSSALWNFNWFILINSAVAHLLSGGWRLKIVSLVFGLSKIN